MKTKFNFIKLALFAVLTAAVYAIATVAMPEHAGITTVVTAMGTAVGTPGTLASQNALAIRLVAQDRKLREDSVLPSVFTHLETALKVINDEITVTKAGVFMRIEAGSNGNAQSIKLAMGLPFRKAPQLGTAESMLGEEDEKELLWTELFYNEIKKSVKYHKFGYHFNDTAYLKWVESYGPGLITFMQDYRDYRIHNTLLLGCGPELTAAPVSKVQTLNPNWVIPNTTTTPLWDNTPNTITLGAADADGYYSDTAISGATAFAENVAAAMMEGSGTGSSGNAILNVDMLYYISWYVRDILRIEPIMLDGQPTYVLLVPSRVRAWLMNPNNVGSLGEAFQKVEQYKDGARAKLPQEIGRVCGNLVFCENLRAPSLTVGGDAGTYSLTPGFVAPGGNDDRNTMPWSNISGSTNYVFDVMIGLGANAIAEYLFDPLNTKLFENDQYGQIEGRGAYLGEGMQLPLWDKDVAGRLDGASKTMIYRGSFIVPISRRPIFKPIT